MNSRRLSPVGGVGQREPQFGTVMQSTDLSEDARLETQDRQLADQVRGLRGDE